MYTIFYTLLVNLNDAFESELSNSHNSFCLMPIVVGIKVSKTLPLCEFRTTVDSACDWTNIMKERLIGPGFAFVFVTVK